MKISFFYEYGKKREIGTGHKYRSQTIGELLEKNGHRVSYIEDGVLPSDTDVLVVDHIYSQNGLINTAKRAKMKTVLIDGAEEDADMVDLSISPFYNDKAQYKGGDYIVIPECKYWMKYKATRAKNTVFIAMGGFDAENHAEFVLEILDELKVNAIIARSINHPDFSEHFSRAEMFEGDDYYHAMHECTMAVTNGGLSFFEALHYGMPTIAVPQYKHQQHNIGQYAHCCIPGKRNAAFLKDKIGYLLDNEYHRVSLSKFASHFIDGKGARRICTLIENLQGNPKCTESPIL